MYLETGHIFFLWNYAMMAWDLATACKPISWNLGISTKALGGQWSSLSYTDEILYTSSLANTIRIVQKDSQSFKQNDLA